MIQVLGFRSTRGYKTPVQWLAMTAFSWNALLVFSLKNFCRNFGIHGPQSSFQPIARIGPVSKDVFDRMARGLGCTPGSSGTCLAPLCLSSTRPTRAKISPSAWLHSYAKKNTVAAEPGSHGARRPIWVRFQLAACDSWAANLAPRRSPNNTRWRTVGM